MCPFQLQEAFAPAQNDVEIRDTKVGTLLREIASDRPHAEVLVEVTIDGITNRRWTYAELLQDIAKLIDAQIVKKS